MAIPIRTAKPNSPTEVVSAFRAPEVRASARAHAEASSNADPPAHTAVIASPPNATTSPPDAAIVSIAGSKNPLRIRTSSSVPDVPSRPSRSLSVVNPLTSRKRAAPSNRPIAPGATSWRSAARNIPVGTSALAGSVPIIGGVSPCDGQETRS